MPLQVSAAIAQTADITGPTLASNQSSAYDMLVKQIQQVEELAREAFQEHLRTSYQPLLARLEAGKPLSPDDIEQIRQLMVGEARAYVEEENDLDNWKSEIGRIVNELQRNSAGEPASAESFMRIRALCRDALRVLPDIAYYLREKERVERFEQAAQTGISAEQGMALAEVIRSMAESPGE